ncbi:MAG: HAD-IA family hydrolase [Bacteroidota bacterium]
MTLIFDFDGTLANTLDLILDLYNQHITKQFSCKYFDKSKIEEFRIRRPISFLREFGITPIKLPFIIYRVRKLMKAHITEAQLFEGMKEVLTTLHAENIKMGIVTSNSTENVQLFLAHHKIEHYFSFIRSSKSLTSKKRSLRKVIAQNKLIKDDTIYIGDEIRDIRSSKAADIKCAAVTWGHQHRSLLEQEEPYAILETTKDILNLIRDAKNHSSMI